MIKPKNDGIPVPEMKINIVKKENSANQFLIFIAITCLISYTIIMIIKIITL